MHNKKLSFSVINSSTTYDASMPTTGIDPLLIGPLVDGMVVSEDLLPELIRATVINANTLISELMNDNAINDAKAQREKLILSIARDFEKFKDKQHEQYYKHYFIDPFHNTRYKKRSQSVSSSKHAKNV